MIVTGAVSGKYDSTRANAPLGAARMTVMKKIGETAEKVHTIAASWLSLTLFPRAPEPPISVP